MVAPARILVVEDEPRLARAAAPLPRARRPRVTSSATGRAAIAAIDAEPRGPGGPRPDAARAERRGRAAAIRERGDTPVLIASAKRSDAERIAGLRMGADDYLAKPFNPHELTARVAAILRRSRGGRAARRTTVTSRRQRGRSRSAAVAWSFDPASRRFTLVGDGRRRSRAA